MNKDQKTVILRLTKTLTNEEYSRLYFELRRQVWSGVLVLPPDIEFLGVCGDDDAIAIISKEKDGTTVSIQGGESMNG